MNDQAALSELLTRVRGVSLLAGVIGGAGCVAGYLFDPRGFFPGYLVGWLFWLAVALGCLVFSMIHNSTGGAWGIVLRPVLESANDTMPLVMVLFVPLMFGLGELYPWTDPGTVAADEKLSAKAAYLNLDAYTVRTVAYFAIWILLAVAVNRWSRADDARHNARVERRRTLVSGPGLILYGLTITLASIDWVMSIEPRWYSTMYGTIFMAGQAVSGLAFAILVTAALADYPPWNRVAHPARFHDLGNLLLTAIVFWIYVSFMQFLLIWGGNLTEENPYYVIRSQGGWPLVAVALAGLHFFVPFAALLGRDLKHNRRALAFVAGLLLVMRLVDWYWLAIPSFDLPAVDIAWPMVAAVVGIGGFWMALFAWRLSIRAQWPIGEHLLKGNLDERPRYQAQ